jgi:hypothetical protein
MILVFAAAFLAIFLVFWVLSPALNWDGGAWAHVRVRVTDASTGQPLSHVTLAFLDNDGLPTNQTGATTGNGVGTVNVLVGAGGTRGLVYESMDYGRDDAVILVHIPGYQDQKVVPGNGSTFKLFGFGPKPKLRVDVKLVPSSSPSATSATSR